MLISTVILTAMGELYGVPFTMSPNMFLSSISFNNGNNSDLEKAYYMRFSQMTPLDKGLSINGWYPSDL